MKTTALQFLQHPISANCYWLSGENEFLQNEARLALTKHMANTTQNYAVCTKQARMRRTTNANASTQLVWRTTVV